MIALQEIIVGRPRDGSDRVTWLLDHSRFEQALNIIESDVTLSQDTREQASCLTACPQLQACLLEHPGLHLIMSLLDITCKRQIKKT